MVDTKISELTDGGTVQAADDIPVERASGNVRVQVGAELAALAGNSSTGVLARTASATYAFRTLTGTTDQITVTNGDGVSGNPTFAAVVASQAEAEAGTDTTKLMTAQRTSQAISALAGGASLPVDDTTALVRDPADNTKQVRVDCGGLATATTAVLTVDSSIDFTEILSGTSGQKLGFDATPEAAVYTDTQLANINVDGTAQTVKFVTPYDGTVVACTGETDVGTVNVAVQIDGVNVTGLTAVALDSTIAGNRDTSSAANTFTKGDVVSVTTSGHASSPTAILIVVEMTQSSLPAALT